MGSAPRRERERLRREQYMLDAAEEIFARDGYENASVNEIARAAEFSKRTLYQYFGSKSDLYLSVALRLYQSLLSRIEGLNLCGDNGYNKVRELFLAYYQFYKANESVFRIIYDIGKVRQETDNPKLDKVLEIDRAIFGKLENLIKLGQEDGSISSNLDTVLTARSLIFLITGFFNQLTITGNSYTSHIQKDGDTFSTYVLDLLHSCLK